MCYIFNPGMKSCGIELIPLRSAALQSLNPAAKVCSRAQGAVWICSYISLPADVFGLPELCSQAVLSFSAPLLTHTHPGKDESSHLCPPPPPPPFWFYNTATPAFSTGSIFIFILILQLHCFAPLFFLTSPPPPSHPHHPPPRCWSIHSIPGRCENPPASSPIHPPPPSAVQLAARHRPPHAFGQPDHPSMDCISDVGDKFTGGWTPLLFLHVSFCPPLLTPSLLFLPQPQVSATPLTHLK